MRSAILFAFVFVMGRHVAGGQPVEFTPLTAGERLGLYQHARRPLKPQDNLSLGLSLHCEMPAPAADRTIDAGP
jgi:hypothetical protein